jgi:hypothetical protein
MKRTIFNIALLIAVIAGVTSCKNEADPEADKSFFTRFYDNSNFNIAYIPLDVVQSGDGGYIVLGLKRTIAADGSDVDPGVIYIMKTDASGAFISDTELDASFVTPAPSLLDVNQRFYFFCMDMSTLSIQLIEVDGEGSIAQQLNVGGSYPLAAGVDGTSLMLLRYDQGSRTTVMSTVTTDGHSQKSRGFTIGPADGPYTPESPIMDHILRTGRRLPFLVGKTPNGLYYFNGMYNYTLSIVFTDLNAVNPIGVIQGNQDDGGISALHALSGGKFAAARFNYGDNYILPATTLSSTGVSSSAELGGNSFPEVAPNAPVAIRNVTINGTERILYASNTRGKQIALFGYNPADGAFVGSRYIGFSNTFELAAIRPTSDNGLVVLGTTYIAGRFPRICLFKLSAEALSKSFK